ncbi:MAG: hypothetical protein LBC12_03855 [Nitrososphaerota archaeon]|nr:hypothetical protein [Nitrososphaerota archaeon]
MKAWKVCFRVLVLSEWQFVMVLLLGGGLLVCWFVGCIVSMVWWFLLVGVGWGYVVEVFVVVEV